MKGLREIAAIVFIALATLFSSYWLEAVKGRGGIPGEFLSWGAGARSLAMGKAFVAVSNDASATYWNPAGLGDIERQEAMMLHTMLWAGTSYDFLSYVKPMINLGAIGLSLVRLYTGGFEGYDIWNERTTTFSDDQMAVTMSIGKKLLKTFSIGANFRYLKHTLAWHTNSSFVVDIAGLYSVPKMSNLSIGLNLQNVFENEISPSKDKLPFTIRLGAAYKQFKNRLGITADFVSIAGTPGLESHFGVEYWAMKYLALRAGMDSEEKSFGFGLNWKNIGFDYAIAMHDLGISHRMSASVRFGPSIAAKRELDARQEYLKAHAAFDKGYFVRGKDFLHRAVSLSPHNSDYLYEFDRIDVIIGKYKEAPKPTKEHELIRRATRKYLDRRVDHALEILRYLLTLDPGNAKVIGLINAIKEKEGITEPEPELPTGMSLVDKKLYDSLNFFYEGKYEKALKLAQDVLILEPNSALAYKRIGSAFYAIGEIDKALSNWRKSVELDPTDEKLRQFIDKIEAERSAEPTQGIDFLKSMQ
ncbi:MAG: PorV/PorQ family protein [Elusimicrobia bacterium]|nr:PorV/PorQ family protein [Elusimicrobiota bacterium]